MERFGKAAEKCAEKIRQSGECLVVSHIDADGLTAAGITCLALQRAGKPYDVRFVKKLDEAALKDIANKAGKRLVIFTDLGSGATDQISALGINAIVTDHHQPKDFDFEYHMNPHLVGLNGATDISGAGVAFLLAMKLGPNEDLSSLAIVGAVGDLQDMRTNALVGVNRGILELGVAHGFLSYEKDLKLFGRQTRPLYKLLQYSSDPFIPGLGGNEGSCIAFLENAGVQVKTENWRRWIDLSRDEKTRVISRLFQYCLACGMPARKVQRLIGETYTLTKETPGTEPRDASEYSTLLNATARYEYSDIGLAVCMGDRGDAFHTARDLLDNHRRNLVSGLNYVSDKGRHPPGEHAVFRRQERDPRDDRGHHRRHEHQPGLRDPGRAHHRAGDLRLRRGDQGIGPGQPRPDRAGPEPREGHRRSGGGSRAGPAAATTSLRALPYRRAGNWSSWRCSIKK